MEHERDRCHCTWIQWMHWRLWFRFSIPLLLLQVACARLIIERSAVLVAAHFLPWSAWSPRRCLAKGETLIIPWRWTDPMHRAPTERSFGHRDRLIQFGHFGHGLIKEWPIDRRPGGQLKIITAICKRGNRIARDLLHPRQCDLILGLIERRLRLQVVSMLGRMLSMHARSTMKK